MQIDIVALVTLPFAVWRISNILVSESGPFDIMDKIRYLAGVRYNEYSEAYGTNTFADLFTCIWCMSVWVSLALVSLVLLLPVAGTLVSLVFALSCMAIIIDTLLEKLNG